MPPRCGCAGIQENLAAAGRPPVLPPNPLAFLPPHLYLTRREGRKRGQMPKSQLAQKLRLMLITDRQESRLPLEQAVDEALRGGVTAVMLREKDLPARDLYNLGMSLRQISPCFGRRRGAFGVAIHSAGGGEAPSRSQAPDWCLDARFRGSPGSGAGRRQLYHLQSHIPNPLQSWIDRGAGHRKTAPGVR